MTRAESLCHPQRVAESFRRAGIPIAGSSGLQLERAWPKRGGGLMASYRADGDLWSIHGPVAAPPRAARSAIRAGQAFYLPDLACWAHRFPFDPSLPELSRRIDSERERECRGGVPQLRVVTYKPLRRCVLETAGQRFVKILRPAAAAKVASTYAAISTIPRFGPMEVLIPEIVDLERGVLEWRRAPGGPLLQGLDATETAERLHRVGSGLGRLQQACLRWPQHQRGVDELTTVERWVEGAAAAFPDAAEGLHSTLRELTRALPNEDGTPPVPTHRDFHQGQLLASGNRLSLLDLDTACLASPELDVANFLAHLRLESLGGDCIDLEQGSCAFLKGHEAAIDRPLNADRLRWYEASALLRLACVHAFRPHRTSLCRDLVSSAAHRLAQPSPR